MDLSFVDQRVLAAPPAIPPSEEGLAHNTRQDPSDRPHDLDRRDGWVERSPVEDIEIVDEDGLTEAQSRAYDSLVRASLRAAMTLLIMQVISSLTIGNLRGADITVVWWRILPYLSMRGTEELLIASMGWSTLISVTVTCVLAIWSLRVRKTEPAITYGWGTGIFMSLFLVAFQFLRQWLFPPAASTMLLAQAGVIALGSAILFFGFWPDVESSVPNESTEGPNRIPSGGHTK